MNTLQAEKINRLHFSKTLRSLRHHHGLTLQDASTDLKLNISALSNYENGKAMPKFAMMSRLCAYYSMTILEFYEYAKTINTSD